MGGPVALKDDLINNVDSIIAANWQVADGRVVPESEKVPFIGNAVRLDATFLYADLADSTALASRSHQVAAEVFQCFLSSASRLIRAEGGEIRSFDGDRVMAVFIGNMKNSTAARCALKINWAFIHVVRPKLLAAYPAALQGYNISYCSGIDTGEIWAVRGGVRDDSDLVWVGKSPNLAAKLSAIRDGEYHTYITKNVYDRLEDNSKFGGNPRRDMWESRVWTSQGSMSVYRSNFSWVP